MNLYCLYCLRQQWYLYWYQECPCCSHTKPKHLPIYFQINIYFMYLMMQSKKKGFDLYFLWNSLKQRSLVSCYEWLDMASCLWYMSHSKRRKKKVNLEGYDILPWEMGAIWLKKNSPFASVWELGWGKTGFSKVFLLLQWWSEFRLFI